MYDQRTMVTCSDEQGKLDGCCMGLPTPPLQHFCKYKTILKFESLFSFQVEQTKTKTSVACPSLAYHRFTFHILSMALMVQRGQPPTPNCWTSWHLPPHFAPPACPPWDLLCVRIPHSSLPHPLHSLHQCKFLHQCTLLPQNDVFLTTWFKSTAFSWFHFIPFYFFLHNT